MKNRTLWWAVSISLVLALAVAIGALAGPRTPDQFSGIINDYTPASGISGPWEMHGTWSLKLNEESGKADFFAVMTMEHPDSWIAANPGTPTTPNIDNPVKRNPHTHHIVMTDAMVSYDPTVCPTDSPSTTVRFLLTGPASVTGNGSPAPFQVAKGLSTLQVCVTGGTDVQYSNVTLSFASLSPASGHFGSQAIHGVVRTVRYVEEDDSH